MYIYFYIHIFILGYMKQPPSISFYSAIRPTHCILFPKLAGQDSAPVNRIGKENDSMVRKCKDGQECAWSPYL